MQKQEKTKSVLKRFARSAVCGILGATVAFSTSNPLWLILSPALQALGKFLRIKWAIKNIPF